MPDWNKPEIVEWKKEARAQQQAMFIRLGDREWDEWNRSDTTILHRKVGFAVFDLPQNLPEEANHFTGYDNTQLEKIKLIADVIERNAKNDNIMHFGCIFMYGKTREKKFRIPVFKIKGEQDQTLFVDSDGRLYRNWHNYLSSNHLPKCMYCYPSDGLYQGNEGQVLVQYDTSPACNPIHGIFFFVQGVTNLVDRLWHGQTIGFDDPESRIAWHDIVNSLRLAQDYIFSNITQTAAAGDIINKAQIIAYNVLTIGILTVDGLETFNGFISLVDKAKEGNLTSLDVFHFSTSVLFFSNSLLHTDTARGIIENTQTEVLNCHSDDLTPSQIEELFQLLDQVQGETEIHKNAKKIKAINHISDKQSFYESLVTARSDLEGHQVQFSFEEPGLVNIDNELHIAPNKLVQISEDDRRDILDAAQKVRTGAMNDDAYRKNVEKVLKNNRIRMEYQRREAITKLEQAFHTDDLESVKIGYEHIFKNMTPSELDRLADVMTGSGKNYNPKILKIANEFAKMQDCKTPRDYCNYVEFTAKYLSDLKTEKETEYREALKSASEQGHVNTNQFALDYGIKGKRSDHFTRQVFDSFDTNWTESFNALQQRYIDLERVVRPLNETIVPNFASHTAAVYHYFKHSEFGSEQLTPEEYFKIASELVNEPLNRRIEQLNQQGNKTVILFTDPIRGAKGIVFETLPDKTQSLATVFYDRNVLEQFVE